MNVLDRVRKQVIVNGKLRYGAASRLSALLGLGNGDVKRIFVGSPRGRYEIPTAEQLRTLGEALEKGVELFAQRADTTQCDEAGCKSKCHAKGKCKRHYFQTWRKGLISA